MRASGGRPGSRRGCYAAAALSPPAARRRAAPAGSPLPVGDPHRADGGELLRRLDVLRHRAHAEPLGERLDRRHDGPALGVGLELLDEGAVDLDVGDRQLLREPQRVEAGAEVVQRDAAAEGAQPLHPAACEVEVAERRALGQLDAQPPPEAGLPPQRRQQIGGEAALGEAQRRDVEVDHRARIGEQPADDDIGDVAVDRRHQPEALGRGQELPRRDHPPVLAAQPHQRLEGVRRAALEVDDRLVVELEAAGLERLPHRLDQPVALPELPRRVRRRCRAGPDHPVLALLLGRVHRGVHLRDDGRGLGARGDLGDADADAEVAQPARRPHVGALKHLADALGGGECIVQRAAAQQHGELVAGEPHHQRRSRRRLDRARRGDQDLVARAVPQRVVDELEVVDVHQRQRRSAPRHRLGDRLAQRLLQHQAVGEVRERVVVREVLQPPLVHAALADVAPHAQHLVELAVAQQRAVADLERDVTPVAAHDLHLGEALAVQLALELAGDVVHGRAVPRRQQLPPVATDQLGPREAGQRLACAVDGGQAPRQVARVDHVVGALPQLLDALLGGFLARLVERAHLVGRHAQ